MNQPRISILIPIYNGEKYLNQAIDSILNQTYADWELILVNDGSTDNSEQIIESYTDARIKYLKNEENKGIVYTRKRLIAEAKGEYIAFLDCDDIACVDKLRVQIDFLDANKDYGFCGTWGKMIDDEQQVIKKINLSVDTDEIKCTLLFVSSFVQSSIMIRRQLIIEHTYDEAFPLAEDYELWCRLLRVCKAKNLPRYLTMYRWHEENVSQSKKEQLENLVTSIHSKELALLGLSPSSDELLVHAAISNADLYEGEDKEYFEALHTWLCKLYKAGKKSGFYSANTWRATICFRWIFACKERNSYLKALALPLLLNPVAFALLCRMLYNRLKG